MKYLLRLFFVLILLGLSQTGCDLREGTIVYDVDFPPANANVGSGGSSSDGSGTHTSTNDFGAGYRVSESDGNSSVIESGAGDTLNITLVKAPTANVMLAVVSVDTGEVTLSTNTLTFTPDNWNVAQTVNLSAVEDGIADGDQITTTTVTVASSNDRLYARDVPSTDLRVTTVDSCTIVSSNPNGSGTGITVTQSSCNLTVTESGAGSSINVVLNAAPTQNVTLTIASFNGEISASPATVTFTPSNWNTPQTVTISAVEDGEVDGDQTTTFRVYVSSSTDSNYSSGVPTAYVPVRVIDSGMVPGITISASGGNTQLNESGAGDTLTVVLNTPPTDNVTVTLSDNDTDNSEVSYSPTSITFTPSNWNTSQTITISALEDYIQDGHQTTLLTMTSSSSDTVSDNLTATTELLTIDSQTAAGITISQSSLTLTESGASDNLTFKLNTPPSGTVTLSLTDNDSDNSEISYSPTSLSFDNLTWMNAQTVSFSAIEDATIDGDQTLSLSVAVSSSVVESYSNTMNTSLGISVVDSRLVPPTAPVLDNATPAAQQNTVYWTPQGSATSYTLYWTSNGSTPTTSSDNITITDNTSTSYVHAGLDHTKTYKYILVAQVASLASALSNEVSASPSAFSSCSTSSTPTDSDGDLLVHYGFDDNLNDLKNSNYDGRYNLTNPGGTIKYAQSCAFNKAAYFDSTTGYLENDNFTQTNIPNLSGNFSIALWVNPTAGMYNRNAAVMNSGWDNQNNFQIDSDSNNRFDWDNSETNRPVYQPYTANQWYYLVAVKYDNGTAALYVDGLLSNPPAPNVGTVHNFTTRWDGLALGLARSRTAAAHWKGYVDEFKVYRRSLSAAEVRDKCLGYAECNDLPPNKPTNLVAEGGSRSGQIELSWDNMTGADNYTVYWTDTPSTPINPADPSTYDNSTVVTTTSTSIANLTNGQPYDFTVVAHNAAGNSTPAEEANATPSIPTVGVTVTQSNNSTSVIEEGQIGYTFYTALLGTPQDDHVRAVGRGRLYLNSKGQYNDLMATSQRIPSFSGSYPPNLAPHAQQYERGSRGLTIYPRFNRNNDDQTVVISNCLPEIQLRLKVMLPRGTQLTNSPLLLTTAELSPTGTF